MKITPDKETIKKAVEEYREGKRVFLRKEEPNQRYSILLVANEEAENLLLKDGYWKMSKDEFKNSYFQSLNCEVSGAIMDELCQEFIPSKELMTLGLRAMANYGLTPEETVKAFSILRGFGSFSITKKDIAKIGKRVNLDLIGDRNPNDLRPYYTKAEILKPSQGEIKKAYDELMKDQVHKINGVIVSTARDIARNQHGETVVFITKDGQFTPEIKKELIEDLFLSTPGLVDSYIEKLHQEMIEFFSTPREMVWGEVIVENGEIKLVIDESAFPPPPKIVKTKL